MKLLYSGVSSAHIKHKHHLKGIQNCVFFKYFIFIVTLLIVIDYCLAVKCYKCSVTVEKNFIRNITVTTPMCSKFDESEDYIVDCPFSTMCLKTISTLYLQNGQKLNTVTRGCAQQKDTTQVFRNRQWQQEHSVQEVYEEGCIEFKDNSLAASGKAHCYCRGNLCNSGRSSNTLSKQWIIIFTEIMLFKTLLWFAFKHYR